MTSDDTPRPTTASVDRRVEGLESDFRLLSGTVNGLVTDVRVMQAGQMAHQEGLKALGAKMDLLIGQFAQQREDSADISGTPAHRALLREIEETDRRGAARATTIEAQLVEQQERVATALQRSSANASKIAAAGAVLGALIILANLFAPLVRVVLGIP